MAATSGRVQVILGLLVMVYWFLRFRDHSWLFLLIVMTVLIIPRDHCLPANFDHQARVVKIRDNYSIVMVNGQRLITYDLSDVGYDDTITFTGTITELEAVTTRYGFSFVDWLNSEGVYQRLKIEDYTLSRKGQTLRHYLLARIKQLDDPPIRYFLGNLLFDCYHDDSGYSDDVLNLFGSLGLYLGSAVFLLSTLLGYFMYPKSATLVITALLGLLGLRYGFSVIIWRLLLQQLLLMAVQDRHDRIGILMTVLLLINPDYVHSLSFQFALLYRFLSLFRRERRFGDILLTAVPLQLLNFYRINLFSLLGLLVLRYYFFSLYLLGILSLLLNRYGLIAAALKSFELINQLMGDLTFTGRPALIWLLFWIAASTHYLRDRRRFTLLMMAGLLLLNQYQMFLNPVGEVTFINVGQGDSIYIRWPFSNAVMLIDTGPPSGYSRLKAYLDAQGIRTLQVLLITHDDSDHSGNVTDLIKDYQVTELITEKRAAITYKDLQISELLSDEHFDDPNEDSQILYFNLNGLRYLLLGDITKDVEQRLIKRYPGLEADIVKAAHHGSATASSDKLLSKLRPRFMVISCGKNNIYHHPSPEVISRLTAYRIPYLVTADSGDISIYFTYFANLLLTSKAEFAIIK